MKENRENKEKKKYREDKTPVTIQSVTVSKIFSRTFISNSEPTEYRYEETPVTGNHSASVISLNKH